MESLCIALSIALCVAIVVGAIGWLKAFEYQGRAAILRTLAMDADSFWVRTLQQIAVRDPDAASRRPANGAR